MFRPAHCAGVTAYMGGIIAMALQVNNCSAKMAIVTARVLITAGLEVETFVLRGINSLGFASTLNCFLYLLPNDRGISLSPSAYINTDNLLIIRGLFVNKSPENSMTYQHWLPQSIIFVHSVAQ